MNYVCLLSLSQQCEAVLDSQPFYSSQPIPQLSMFRHVYVGNSKMSTVTGVINSVKCLDVSFVAQSLWTEHMKIKLSSMLK